jgi:hypothetical protein
MVRRRPAITALGNRWSLTSRLSIPDFEIGRLGRRFWPIAMSQKIKNRSIFILLNLQGLAIPAA